MMIYTASQIALALGRKREGVRWMLSRCAPSGHVPVHGVLAQAWTFAAMPEKLRAEISALTKECGLRDEESFLRAEPTTWTCPVPINIVRQKFIDEAVKLRDALAEPLKQQHTLTTAALVELGLREYKRVFGYVVCKKQWLRKFDEIVKRIGGAQTWQAIELYLSKDAFRKPVPHPAAKIVFVHREVEEWVDAVEDKEEPTTEERKYLFHKAFEHFETLLPTTNRPGALKRSLVGCIYKALPGIARTEASLKRVFEIKYNEWIGGREIERTVNGELRKEFIHRHPDAIEDRRWRSGQPSYSCEPCDDKIMRLKAHMRNKHSTAARILRQRGELCEKCCERWTLKVRENKSYTPHSQRERTRLNKIALAFIKGGSKQARMVGPYIPGDWSDTKPGEWFVADDETSNHDVFWDVGGERFYGKVQTLKMEDLATGYPLQAIHYFGPPTGRRIMELCRHVFLRGVGLPHLGCLFENGPWASRWIKGEDASVSRPFMEVQSEFLRDGQFNLSHFGPTTDGQESGIRAAGLRLRFATGGRPQAKGTIEVGFNIHQTRMAILPGFVGFNERFDKMERTQDFIRRAEAGKVDPSKGMLSLQEYGKNYIARLLEIAHEPQNGKRLQGRSPAEAWLEQLERHPLRKLPPEMEYLISTHKRLVKVTERGIEIPLSRYEKAVYYNEHTGRNIGKEFIARYNLDFPGILTAENPRTKERFTVERVLCPKTTAAPDQLANANKARNAHLAQARAIIPDMGHPLVNTIIRDDDHTEEAKAFGRFHNDAVATAKDEAATMDRKISTAKRKALAQGISLGRELRDPDGIQEALEMRAAALARLAERENNEAV